ncbi:peptidoglycan DD-metalloendopeptidase family protein [Candidatus Gracilibacteria bacterium]|nr:peptidoglycan DD-metalloendopeptidase family protein [Candidatus Gracilibacteria bacterium]
MKYKSFSILFLAVSLVFGHITFSEGESNTNTGSTSWWMQSIPEASILNDVSAIQSDIYELAYSENRFAELENTFLESRELLSENRDELEAYIEKIEQMQNDIKQNIEKSKNEKEQLENNIVTLEKEIILMRERQEETKKYIRKILIDNYMISPEEKNNVSLYETFFLKTFGSHMSEEDALDTLQDSASQLLERQKSIESELSELGRSVELKIRAKKQILTRLENYQEELADTNDIKKEVLSQTIVEQSLQRKIEKVTIKKESIGVKIEEKFAEYEQTLQSKLTQYNCETRGTAVCVWLRGYIQAEKDLISNKVVTNKWGWPTSPDNGFGFHFRDQKYFTSMNQHHTGLDILVAPGLPIRAMGNGYIVMKQNPSGNFAGIVIVKHPEGLMSMYIGVNPGSNALFSQVNIGDIIATSREYLEHSGKNNVHIELYQNGVQIDPLEKIDIATIPANIVPARYGWKYIDDLKNNQNNPSVVTLKKQIGFFYLEGENEARRQQALLETYASNDFRDRNVWVEESIAESIDPTFVLCIGLAESTLGKNLTTDGNIGNVGNTDSGARRDYDGPREGIRAISSVLNNRWLGRYTTIDQLSGWGNPIGPIYASSQTNWHENIVKCMSAIKGKYVGNKANFRLTKAALLLYEREGFSQKQDS